MKALTWHGKGNIQCDTIPDPMIEESYDIIVKVTSRAICGSDLHLMCDFIPNMEKVTFLAMSAWGKS